MVEDTPDDLVFELHNESLWGQHPYGYSILGTRDTVSALGVRELRELHERAYHPPQLIVAAAGNVQHDHLLETLDRTGWTRVPRGDETRLSAPAPVAAPPGYRHVSKEAAQTHIVYGSPMMAHGHPLRYAAILVSTILGAGMSSRLFQRVREELGLAYSVYTFQSFHADTGVHGVYVGTAPETAADAAAAIRDELASVAADGLTPAEVESGKSQLKGQSTLSLESVSSRMYRAAGVDLYGEPYRTLDQLLAEIDAITEEQVRAVCHDYFSPDAQTIVSLGPKAIQ
jgi:predicted Zn-dependent peptidase